MSIYINIIKSYRDVVAICDSELLGKTFEDEPAGVGGEELTKILDVKESFYKGEEKSPEEVKQVMQKMSNEDATFNIVGPKSIKLAIEEEIIVPEAVGKVQGIPFALILV